MSARRRPAPSPRHRPLAQTPSVAAAKMATAMYLEHYLDSKHSGRAAACVGPRRHRRLRLTAIGAGLRDAGEDGDGSWGLWGLTAGLGRGRRWRAWGAARGPAASAAPIPGASRRGVACGSARLLRSGHTPDAGHAPIPSSLLWSRVREGPPLLHLKLVVLRSRCRAKDTVVVCGTVGRSSRLVGCVF